LGHLYSTLYPTHVRRMVLDSNVDPRRVWYPANLDQDTAFDRNIDIWFAWLARYDSVYHLGKTEKAVRSLWYSQLAALTKKPAGGIIGPDEWTDAFLFAGYYQSTWTDLGDTFSAWIHNHDLNAVKAAYEDADGYPGSDNEYAMYDATQQRRPVAAELGEVAEGQLGHLREGALRDLVQRLVQRSLPVLAGQGRNAGEGRRQQGQQRVAHRRDAGRGHPVLRQSRSAAALPELLAARPAGRDLACQLTVRQRLRGQHDRALPRYGRTAQASEGQQHGRHALRTAASARTDAEQQ
jgi:hypothetical protein